MDRLVVIGEITRPHGLHGEVRVTPLTDDPERFTHLRECIVWDRADDRREPRRVAAARRHGEAVVLALAGAGCVDDARALVGRLVAVPASEARPLPEGWFYPWQLEGCLVQTTDGAEVGRVTGIERSAAHDLWAVAGEGREHLIPAVPEIVVEVNLAARRVIIQPPAGLLDL
jgi:16S rRNA processing protein RimM